MNVDSVLDPILGTSEYGRQDVCILELTFLWEIGKQYT